MIKNALIAFTAVFLMGCSTTTIKPPEATLAYSIEAPEYVLPPQLDCVKNGSPCEPECEELSKLKSGTLSELRDMYSSAKQEIKKCIINKDVYKNWIIRNHIK